MPIWVINATSDLHFSINYSTNVFKRLSLILGANCSQESSIESSFKYGRLPGARVCLIKSQGRMGPSPAQFEQIDKRLQHLNDIFKLKSLTLALFAFS